MNNKGFTLIELLATIIIISLIMAIILPSASKMSRENQEEIYHKYEDMLKEYAMVLKIEENCFIKLDDIDELKEIKEKNCDGFVLINRSGSSVKYDAFVKCSDYSTPNYDQNKLKLTSEHECN